MSLRPDAHVTHELLPREGLGAFSAKRLFWATALSCIGTLLAGIVIDQWRFEEKLHAYPVTQRGCAVSRCVSAAADAVLAQYRDDALVTSQVANAVVLYIWGRLSDRLSNKAILRVALPLYFVCMLGLAFAAIPDARGVTLSMLYVVHIAMGAAAGGSGLATGNMSLKLAPQGQGTAYLAATGLVAVGHGRPRAADRWRARALVRGGPAV
jgi:MFS family permease